MTNWSLSSAVTRTAHSSDGSDPEWRITVDGHTSTAHTDGSYTTLIPAANNFGGNALSIAWRPDGVSVANRAALTIALGDAGQEVDIAPLLPMGYGGYRVFNNDFLLPLKIPAGVRIAAKSRTVDVSERRQWVHVGLVQSSHLYPTGLTRCAHLGYDAANTRGTVVLEAFNPGGAFIDLGTAPFRVRAVQIICWGMVNTNTFTLSAARLFAGPGGQEVPIMPWNYIGAMANANNSLGVRPIYPTDIPSGTRISTRVRAGNSGLSHYVSCLVYG